MIELYISDDFAAAGIETTLACVSCRVAVAAGDQALDGELARELARWEGALAAKPVTEVPGVAGARRAYKALGKDPSRYRVSSEALLRRIGQGKGLHRVNNVVDTNNLVSLHTGLSVGSYRAETLTPPIVFRKGAAGERYPAIGRGPLNLENLPVFADREGPFGSPTSDSERSMVTPDTERLLMVLIGFGAAPDAEAHLSFAAEALRRHCTAADVETAVVRG